MAKLKKAAEEVRQDTPTEAQSSVAVENALTPDTVGVAVDSLEANVGYGSLLRELQHAYIQRVAFYRSKTGGSLSVEEARANAYHA